MAAAGNTRPGGGDAGVSAAGASDATAAQCTDALAATFCASKPATDRFYSNVAAGCTCFYRCTVIVAAYKQLISLSPKTTIFSQCCFPPAVACQASNLTVLQSVCADWRGLCIHVSGGHSVR